MLFCPNAQCIYKKYTIQASVVWPDTCLVTGIFQASFHGAATSKQLSAPIAPGRFYSRLLTLLRAEWDSGVRSDRYDYIYQLNWPGPRHYEPGAEVNEGRGAGCRSDGRFSEHLMSIPGRNEPGAQGPDARGHTSGFQRSLSQIGKRLRELSHPPRCCGFECVDAAPSPELSIRFGTRSRSLSVSLSLSLFSPNQDGSAKLHQVPSLLLLRRKQRRNVLRRSQTGTRRGKTCLAQSSGRKHRLLLRLHAKAADHDPAMGGCAEGGH